LVQERAQTYYWTALQMSQFKWAKPAGAQVSNLGIEIRLPEVAQVRRLCSGSETGALGFHLSFTR
jgi:hypothetical protein